MRLRVFLLAFVAFALLGVTWALASPVLSNPDEPAHSVKAAATVRGQLVPPKEQQPDEGPGSLVRGGFTTRVEVPYSYSWQTSGIPECYIFDKDAPAGCAHGFTDDAAVICPRYDASRNTVGACPPDLASTQSLVRWVTLIGRFQPPYYAAVGWPTLFDTGNAGFFTMRFVSVVLNALLLAAAVACAAAVRRRRFMVIGVLLAATPQTILMAGSINPNGLEVSAAICTWVAASVALLDDRDRLPRGVLATLGVSAVTLVWSRPLSMVWLAVIGVTVLAAFGDRERVRARLRGRAERVTLIVIFVATLGSTAWTIGADALGQNSGYDPRGLDLLPAARHSLALTGSYLRQMVAVFGWQREPSPVWLSLLWGAAVLAVVVVALVPWSRRAHDEHDEQGAGTRPKVVLLALIGFTLLMPTLLQVPSAKRIGFVWSGRYGLPVAVGIPIVAAAMVGARRLSPRALRVLGGSIVVAVAFGQVVAHWANMRRYVVGLDGPVVYFGHDGWTPPLGAPVLLVLVVVASIGLAWLGYRLGVAEPAGPEATDAAGAEPVPAAAGR